MGKNKLLFLAVFTCIFISSCVSVAPKWYGKIWSGYSEGAAIRRTQSQELIECKDPAFTDYICMSRADFKSFYETYVLGCEKWRNGQPMMSPQEAFLLFSTEIKPALERGKAK